MMLFFYNLLAISSCLCGDFLSCLDCGFVVQEWGGGKVWYGLLFMRMVYRTVVFGRSFPKVTGVWDVNCERKKRLFPEISCGPLVSGKMEDVYVRISGTFLISGFVFLLWGGFGRYPGVYRCMLGESSSILHGYIRP